MSHRILKGSERYGNYVGIVPGNFCELYNKLIDELENIVKHFPDITEEFVKKACDNDWPSYVKFVVETMYRHGMHDEFAAKVQILKKNDRDQNLFTLAAELCTRKRLFAHAFGFYDLGIGFSIGQYGLKGTSDQLIMKAKEVQAVVEMNVVSYQDAFMEFEPIWGKFLVIGGAKCTMYQFIDLDLDDKIFRIYESNYQGDKHHEGTDVHIRFLDKRLRYEYWPYGMRVF